VEVYAGRTNEERTYNTSDIGSKYNLSSVHTTSLPNIKYQRSTASFSKIIEGFEEKMRELSQVEETQDFSSFPTFEDTTETSTKR